MEQKNIDEELEHVFGKLKQLKVGSARNGRKRCQRRTSQQNKEHVGSEEDIKHKDTIHQTIKSSERKSVIKESRLKLPKKMITQQTPHNTDEQCKLFEQQGNGKETDPANDKTVTIKRSCSTEFRNAHLLMQEYKQENIDNTSPSELAEYLEQILHFPKPMSAMAEMMYG